MDESTAGDPDNKSEITGLSRQLQEIDQRLQALMPQDVDAIIGAGGKSYMLQQAQLGLLRSERDQRGMARQLRIESERLVAAQAVAKIGSWSMDIASGHIEWSVETHKIFETDPHRFKPEWETVLMRLDPEDQPRFRAAFANSLRGSANDVLEHGVAFPGGTKKYVEQRWQVERNEHGEPTRALGTSQDVTARRLSEAALRQNQAQLSMASRLGRIGAWSVDLAKRILLWSPEVYAIHGVAPGTPLDVECAINYYAPEGREILRNAVALCATQGTPYDLELEILTEDGRRIWVRSMGEAVRDSDGVIRLIQGAIQDLSDRKQAEKETRRLATRLVTTLESLTVSFYATDHGWRFTYVNAEAERMLERRRDDLLGRTLWDEFPHLLGTVFEEAFRRAVSEQCATTVDGQLRGGPTWVRASAYPSEEGLAVSLRDISVERAEHQQLKLLEASVERLNDMVMITEATPLGPPGPRIQFVNDAVLRTTGYSREELLGATPRLLQGPATDRTELDRIRDSLATSSPVHAELINYTRAGDPYWLELDIVPVAGGAPGQTHFVAIERDISARKRDQDALRELNQELENRVRLRTAELNVARETAEKATVVKSTFLASMSHEIRTPMNGVIGLVDVLAQSSLRPAQTEMVELIRDSADSLLNIIDDILDFSKIEAGKLRIDQAPMRICDVIERVCSLLELGASKRGVSLTVFVDPDIPPSLLGDELRIRQILVNLIGNAIKFSSGLGRPGRVEVRAELHERTADRATVMLVVSDNGIGIDAETRGRLFQPFSQADASTTRRFGGTGLGLAITHMLVELMGGQVAVQSAPGEGADFRVLLPMVSLPDANVDTDSETDALVKGLRCRIIGESGHMAPDLAKYLSRAGAIVERSADLTIANAAKADWDLCVWLILPDQTVPNPTELRTLAHCDSGQQTRFLVLGRGRRRRPRLDEADLVRIDVDGLSRRTLFKSLAMVAGRSFAEAQDARLNSAAAALEPTRSDKVSLPYPKILVAEDNETNREVIERQLRLLGIAAEIVGNGEDALHRWRSGEFEVLLTDLRMPRMDGYALAAAIRQEEAGVGHTVIIALTANALPEERTRCLGVGMDDFVTKPVRLSNLRATMNRWLTPVENLQDVQDSGAAAWARKVPADLSVLTNMVGEDPADIRAVLDTFRRTSEKLGHQLHDAIISGAANDAREVAHKLKSGAFSVGAERLGRICEGIEDIAASGRCEGVAVRWPELDAELMAVRVYLEELGKSFPNSDGGVSFDAESAL